MGILAIGCKRGGGLKGSKRLEGSKGIYVKLSKVVLRGLKLF